MAQGSQSVTAGQGVATPVTIDPSGEFYKLAVWFTGVDKTDGNIRIEDFRIGTTVIPEDQPLQFGIAATDGDGDVTATQTLDVFLQGGAGPDYTIAGNTDILVGSDGKDALTGGGADQVLIGGKGSDTLEGGSGSDVFEWSLGDQGTADAPATDVIKDFAIGTGGDVLNLHDLLNAGSGVAHDAATLDQYLDFDEAAPGGDVVINVHPVAAGDVTQKITLEGVSLAELHALQGGANNLTDDQDIISKMIANGNLKTDV